MHGILSAHQLVHVTVRRVRVGARRKRAVDVERLASDSKLPQRLADASASTAQDDAVGYRLRQRIRTQEQDGPHTKVPAIRGASGKRARGRAAWIESEFQAIGGPGTRDSPAPDDPRGAGVGRRWPAVRARRRPGPARHPAGRQWRTR